MPVFRHVDMELQKGKERHFNGMYVAHYLMKRRNFSLEIFKPSPFVLPSSNPNKLKLCEIAKSHKKHPALLPKLLEFNIINI